MDDDLPPDIAALCVRPTVKVRLRWECPPFRAYWSWNGITRSVARWGPFAARDRARELFASIPQRAIDRWFEDRREARRRDVRWRQLAGVIGKEKATDLFMKVYSEWPPSGEREQ